ncbi:MAG: Hint domain-containing protein [bacterium]
MKFYEYYHMEDSILIEGGGYGHLLHPFEDNDLTFENMKEMISKTLTGDLSTTQEKCIQGESTIILEKNGETPIKDVVENKIKDNVLSFDESTNSLKYKEILDYADNGETSEWLEIELENGDSIKVTPNHKFFVDGIGYVRAEELTENSILIVGE